MKTYRLKKEAVPFVLDKHATSIYPLDDWESLQIDIKALEEVKSPYISYGIKNLSSGSSLCGWSDKDKSHFHFTINFPSMKYNEHDEFKKGGLVRDFMDKIQSVANHYFDDFVNDKLEIEK